MWLTCLESPLNLCWIKLWSVVSDSVIVHFVLIELFFPCLPVGSRLLHVTAYHIQTGVNPYSCLAVSGTYFSISVTYCECVCASLLGGTVFFISSRSTLSILLVRAEQRVWLSCWLSCSWSCCCWFWLSARTRSSLRSEVIQSQGSQEYAVGGSLQYQNVYCNDNCTETQT